MAVRLRGPREPASVAFTLGWIALALVGIAIFLFGVVIAAVPSWYESPFVRSVAVASIGMGLFSCLITVMAYRRRERWAWFALWY